MSLDLHVKAVLTHLEAGGIPVGRGKKPDGVGWQAAPGKSQFVPYAILWRIGSQDATSNDITDRFEEARPLMFVRCFGGTAEEADTLMGQVRDRMLGDPLDVPGRTVQRVWLDNSQTTTRTDDTEVGLYEAGDFYRIWTT